MDNSKNNTIKKRKRKNRPEPVYHPINTLNHDTIDSFYGFIIATSTPKDTAQDTLLKLVVADSTDIKVNINLFYSDDNDVLDNLQVGAIVRLDRARISKVYGTLLATGNITQGRTQFNLVVISGVAGDSIEPLGSLPQFIFTEKDREIVEQLRERWTEIKNHFITSQQNVINRSPLSDIDYSDRAVVNVVAQVIVKSFSTTAMGKRMNLWVWDGTGDGYELIGGQHRFGVLMDMLSWEANKIPILDSINEGQWILFKKVQPNIYNSKNELKIQTNTEIVPLHKEDPIVVGILEFHQLRVDDFIRTNSILNNNNNNNGDIDQTIPDKFIEPQVFLTDTEYPTKNITKIIDIISPDSQIPHKYRLFVKLLQHIPMNIMNFTRPVCRYCRVYASFNVADIDSCKKCVYCDQVDTIEYVYVIKFILEDDTGSIPVILYDKEAQKFFGLPPVNFHNEKDYLLRIEKDIQKLKEGKEFYCCIKSYYLNDVADPDNIRYQMFDTKVKH